MTDVNQRFRPRDVPVALAWAENDVKTGDYLAALDKFTKVENTLRELKSDDWKGTRIGKVGRRKMLRQAQYGKVTTLLFLRRPDEARAAADRVCDEIFQRDGNITDHRFEPLLLLSVARDPSAFGDVWGQLLNPAP